MATPGIDQSGGLLRNGPGDCDPDYIFLCHVLRAPRQVLVGESSLALDL